MKKGLLVVLIVGMFGWAVFEFVNPFDDSDVEDGVMYDDRITAMPADNSGDVVESDDVGLEKGDMAPDFEVTTLSGEQAKLSDYRGERIMLNFWATWCPPCRAEMPDMQKLYEEEDITILAVNMTETETRVEAVETFVDDYELTFPILMDETSDVMVSYKIQAYPTSYMIDSNGRVQFVSLGAMNHDQMLQLFNKME